MPGRRGDPQQGRALARWLHRADVELGRLWSWSRSERAETTWWVVAALFLAVALVRLWPSFELVGEGRRGVDFRTVVYAPSKLLSEHRDPWLLENAVPRFGPDPVSPVVPSAYLSYPVVVALGYIAAARLSILVQVFVTLVGTFTIGRSFGLRRGLAAAVAAVVLLSPPSRFNIDIVQSAAVPIAALAFFAVARTKVSRSWLIAQRCVYVGLVAYFFAKPTFALGVLAAEMAYRRSARWFLWSCVVCLGTGLLAVWMITARAGIGVGDLVDSARGSLDVLEASPMNGFDGTRIDLLSMLAPVVAVDLIVLALSTLAVVVVGSRWRSTETTDGLVDPSRVVVITGLATLFCYHHFYDSLGLLAVVVAFMWTLPARQGLALGVALVLSGWVYGFRPSQRLAESWGLDWFSWRSRVIFAVGVGALLTAWWQARRRADGRHTAPALVTTTD